MSVKAGLGVLLVLAACAPRLTSTQRFTQNKRMHERDGNVAQAQQQARDRCGGGSISFRAGRWRGIGKTCR